MNNFTTFFEKNSRIQNYVSRKFMVFAILITFSTNGFAASGLFDAYAIFSINSGANTYRQYSAMQNWSIGSFTYGSSSLILKGAQNKTFKNGGSNVTGGQIAYRVYLTSAGSTGVPFSFIQLSFGENYGTPGDQRWETNNATVNLLSGRNVGTYTFEAYFQAFTSDGDSYYSNSGSNYKASFTITAATATVTPTLGQSKVFGATDPTFTFSTSPSVTTSGALSRAAGEDVATSPYAYTIGTLASTNANYTLSLAAGTFAITKATPTITTALSATAINFGQTLASSTISGAASVEGTFTFTTPSTAPNAGTASQDVTFTPTDTANYNSFTTTVSVTVIADTTRPTLVISSTATSPTNVATIPLTFTFSEAVFGFTSADITALGGSLSNFSGSGSTYTATLTPSGDGTISIFVFQDSCTDLSENGNTFSSFVITSDRTRPSVVISSSATSPTSTSPIPITISFSEAVTGFDISDITPTGGTLSGFSGSGADYSVNFNPINSGTKILNIAVNIAIDQAGNNNTAATQFSISYVVPCSRPTTWNGFFWTAGDPVANQPAVIVSDFVATSNLAACSLIIGNDAQVIVPSGYNFTISGSVTVQAGSSLTFENNANLIQSGTTNGNVGNITVKRDSNLLKRLDYTLWSSPVAGTQTLLDFSPLTSAVTPIRFYIYDHTLGANGLYATIPPASTFATGKGYLIRMPNENPTERGVNSNYYKGIDPLIYVGAFTGKPNNGTITLSSLDSDKFYAVGNPYPSTLSADAFLGGNDTAGTLYFWRKTNGAGGTAYATYTEALGGAAGASGITPNGTIQVGQGFIVKASSTSLSFTNSMRETAPTSTQFLKTKKGADKSRLWLDLSDATGRMNQVLIGYLDSATLGFDAGIDGKYFNDSAIALTSIVEGEEYVIQGRPAFDATDVVALNFKTSVAGTYTIAIDHVDGLFSKGQDIYLVDKKVGVTTNLKEGAYNFTAEAGVDNTRFELTYQKTLKVDAPLFNENSVLVSRSNGTVNVKSNTVAINNVKVYDIQGRLVAERKNVKSNTATFSNMKANHVLIMKVTAENNAVVTKKVLN